MDNTRYVQDNKVDEPFGHVVLGEKKAFSTMLALQSSETRTYSLKQALAKSKITHKRFTSLRTCKNSQNGITKPMPTHRILVISPGSGNPTKQIAARQISQRDILSEILLRVLQQEPPKNESSTHMDIEWAKRLATCRTIYILSNIKQKTWHALKSLRRSFPYLCPV